MFDRFTDRARQAMTRSWQEARRLGHDYIGTEHLLLGLLDDDGGAGHVLKDLCVDVARLRAETMRCVTPGPAPIPEQQLPFTPRVRKALELALEEAKGLGHDYIGTEHLLLGLIREEEGIAAKVLAGAMLRIEDVRDRIPRGTTGQSPPRQGHGLFDRFTDRSRKAMGFARKHCLRLGHERIDTEHTLLGLLDEGGGYASEALKRLGVDTRQLRLEIERQLTPGAASASRTRIPFTPSMKRALELTYAEAVSFGHDHLGTEHLLLGLIREEGGIAARELAALGITYEPARREIVGLLGAPPSEGESRTS